MDGIEKNSAMIKIKWCTFSFWIYVYTKYHLIYNIYYQVLKQTEFEMRPSNCLVTSVKTQDFEKKYSNAILGSLWNIIKNIKVYKILMTEKNILFH